VLVFTPFGKDATLIERVLLQSALPICSLGTLSELEEAISEEAGAAIITKKFCRMEPSDRWQRSFRRSLPGPTSR
jgi:hypothetical protein